MGLCLRKVKHGRLKFKGYTVAEWQRRNEEKKRHRLRHTSKLSGGSSPPSLSTAREGLLDSVHYNAGAVGETSETVQILAEEGGRGGAANSTGAASGGVLYSMEDSRSVVVVEDAAVTAGVERGVEIVAVEVVVNGEEEEDISSSTITAATTTTSTDTTNTSSTQQHKKQQQQLQVENTVSVQLDS